MTIFTKYGYLWLENSRFYKGWALKMITVIATLIPFNYKQQVVEKLKLWDLPSFKLVLEEVEYSLLHHIGYLVAFEWGSDEHYWSHGRHYFIGRGSLRLAKTKNIDQCIFPQSTCLYYLYSRTSFYLSDISVSAKNILVVKQMTV